MTTNGAIQPSPHANGMQQLTVWVLVICALVLDVVGVAVVASLNDNPAKKWTAVVLYVVAVAAVPFPAARWFGRKRGWPRTSRTPLAAGISMMLAVPLVLIGYLALTS